MTTPSPNARHVHARLSRRTAVVICLSALLLGTGTGLFLLPDRATTHWTWMPFRQTQSSTQGTMDPSMSAKDGPQTYATTPPTPEDLLSVAAFHGAGLLVKVYRQNGNTSPGLSVSACTDKRTVGARTLGDITGHDPELLGTWQESSTTDTADEVIATAESPAAAKVAADRLLAAHTVCQHQPVSQWVYGPTHQEQPFRGVEAAWLGLYPGQQNRTGQAPADAAPCGGIAVIRNGQRFGLLEVYMCTDAEQLRSLALAAATRLG